MLRIRQLKKLTHMKNFLTKLNLSKMSSERLCFIHYAGDYRETYNRLKNGGDETYFAQKYSVDLVPGLRKYATNIRIVCCVCDEKYFETIMPGLDAQGLGWKPHQVSQGPILKILDEYMPDRLILRTPMLELLKWADRNKVRSLLTLADSYPSKGIRAKIRQILAARSLNCEAAEWVGNHGLTSTLSLKEMGVNPKKLIPYDFPSKNKPYDAKPRLNRNAEDPLQVLFVGTVTELKGVGDLIRAIKKLKQMGQSVRLTVLGGGEVEQFKTLSNQLGIEEIVVFKGPQPNAIVIKEMQNTDMIVVPSRLEYTEGFPFTLSEALCTHTPIIISNHPMFLKFLKHEKNALVFRAKEIDALATSIQRLNKDADLRKTLSNNATRTWEEMRLPVDWGDLVEKWLEDSVQSRKWLESHTLANFSYKLE
jgi:glycosyltransferase involved in cell wall biosynthesis